jgi:site-specific recombinase XerD
MIKNTEIHAQRIFLKGFSGDIDSYEENFLKDRQVSGCRPRTLVYYQEKLQKFIEFCKSREIKNIEQITPNELREFIRLLQENHNPGGVAAHYRAVRSFLHWVELEAEVITWQNPCRRVRMPRVDMQPLEPVEISAIRRLLETTRIRSISSIRDKAIILFLADTGCRAKEILSTDISDYEIATGQVLIRESKNRRPRIVFCSQPTRRAIREYLLSRNDESLALFSNKQGERLEYGGLRSLLERRSRMAGLKKAVTPHQFRRFFALETLRAGADTVSVSRLLGHSNLATVERYLRQTAGDLAGVHSRTSPVNRLK